MVYLFFLFEGVHFVVPVHLSINSCLGQRIALSWMVQKETASLHCSGGILADDQVYTILWEFANTNLSVKDLCLISTLNCAGIGKNDFDNRTHT